MKKCLLALASLCLFVVMGCGGSSSALTGIAAAEDALANGDYSTARTQAQAILDSETSTAEEQQRANLVIGAALLGEAEVVGDDVLAAFEAATTGTLVYDLIPDIDEDTAVDAADALNSGANPESRNIGRSITVSAEKQRLRSIANLSVVLKMLTRVFVIDIGGVTLVEGYTIQDALDYLFVGSRTVAYYAANAADAAAAADFSSDMESLMDLLSDAMANLGLMHAAINGGDPWDYDHDSMFGTINSGTSDGELLETAGYEILRAAFP